MSQFAGCHEYAICKLLVVLITLFAGRKDFDEVVDWSLSLVLLSFLWALADYTLAAYFIRSRNVNY